MNDREKYIKKNNAIVAGFETRSGACRDRPWPRVFPYDIMSINRRGNKTCKKAGMAQKNRDGFMEFHPHTLRNYSSTSTYGLQNALIVWLNVCWGHVPYLKTYLNLLDQNNFRVCMKNTPIHSKSGQLMKSSAPLKPLQKKAIETNSEVQKLKDEIPQLRDENSRLKTNRGN